jgi:pyridoxamine 5'-phosphate oxidase
MNIADLRTEYMRETLDESDVAPDPYRQFEHWFAEASKAQLHEPNAMTLATTGPDGRPAARIVLLKMFDARGFAFFTNYHSRKGRELAANAAAALLFFWPELERQVRIEGTTAPLDPAESAAYFSGRPRGSQLGAWASPQSEPIDGRTALEARFAAVEHAIGRAARCHARRTGADTASRPIPSSSGRAAPRACTIGSAIAARGSTPARGSSTGLRRER